MFNFVPTSPTATVFKNKQFTSAHDMEDLVRQLKQGATSGVAEQGTIHFKDEATPFIQFSSVRHLEMVLKERKSWADVAQVNFFSHNDYRRGRFINNFK